MNNNLWRTLIGLLGGATLLPIVVMLLGCTGGDNPLTPLIVEPYECSTSWIPAKYAALLPFALMLLAGLVKAMRQGSTVVENIAGTTAVTSTSGKVGTAVLVVPETVATTGTVSPSQVLQK